MWIVQGINAFMHLSWFVLVDIFNVIMRNKVDHCPFIPQLNIITASGLTSVKCLIFYEDYKVKF